MKKALKNLEFIFKQYIAADPNEVFDAWLNPGVPGNPWSSADKLIFDLKVDGLFYWHRRGFSHYGYGRFTIVECPYRIQHTWAAPDDTRGLDSIVTVTFMKQAKGTLMTLIHSDLPNFDGARMVEKGWDRLLAVFSTNFGATSRKRKRELHPNI